MTREFFDAEGPRNLRLSNFFRGLSGLVGLQARSGGGPSAVVDGKREIRAAPGKLGRFRAFARRSAGRFSPAWRGVAAEHRRYRLGWFRTLAHRAVGGLPPAWREAVAERWLRREAAPAPAAEHVVQYLLSREQAKTRSDYLKGAVVAKGADLFYERQYRQCFNPVMGAFAMTAELAALGAGGRAEGYFWSRGRRSAAATLDREGAGSPPIIVIDAETVAIPMLLQAPRDAEEGVAVARWLVGAGPMPQPYCDLARGAEVFCCESGARAFERTAQGALLELVDAVTQSRKLAVLALNPCDPDAMGLHVTLFDARFLTAGLLERDHGLPREALVSSREAARARGAMLIFCVGATEEVFTQCSQNLFIKRPLRESEARRRAVRPPSWSPALPLERLIDAQFELLQVTVSASGLPGASPRNGDRGKTAFVERRKGRSFVLIPYFPGNYVHGHAAKLWSNPHGTLLIHDDTDTGAAVAISGACSLLSHREAVRAFPESAGKVLGIKRRNGSPMPEPDYWFAQEVEQITMQRGALKPCALDSARPTCAIHAGGQALFDKKPAYFGAGSLPAYDMHLLHRREAAGRRRDPSGAEHDRWNLEVREALSARLTHLETVR